jgi:pimeloyl-ACP methyl ester carboxylesterase
MNPPIDRWPPSWSGALTWALLIECCLLVALALIVVSARKLAPDTDRREGAVVPLASGGTADRSGAVTMTKPSATLVDRWTIVNDLPLFARVAVDAAPPGALPLIHVHGCGSSGRYLAPTAERLAPFFPAYVPDLPGHGRSHRPKCAQTIPELADALAGFMDAVGVPKAILLGNSMGCLVVVEFAHKYPDRIERAILVSPAGGPHNQPMLRGLSQLVLDGLRERLRMLPVAVPDCVRAGPISSLRLFREMVQYPTVERAFALDVPILAVFGFRDPLVSNEQVKELSQRHANVTLVFHRRAAHAISFSHPEALAEVVRAWLDDRPIVAEGETTGEIGVVGRPALGQDGP